MNKDKLQQELKEKIREGIKPSDLKKKKTEGNIGSIHTPPPPITSKEPKSTPNPSNSNDLPSPISIKIKQLEEEVKYWSETAANYLKRLGQLEAELDNKPTNSDERSLLDLDKFDEGYESDNEQEPKTTTKELELALKEANQKIRELETKNNQWKETITKSNTLISEKEKIIKNLQQNNQSLNKTIEELKNQPKNKETNQEQKLFTCHSCQLEWSPEFLQLKTPDGKEYCWDCVDKMEQTAKKRPTSEF